MKVRKVKDMQQVLLKKGFVLHPEKDHHQFYILHVNGIKQTVRTYFSHGKKEYGSTLMTQIKKQLKFKETALAEDFFDCPMSGVQYVDMLKENGTLQN